MSDQTEAPADPQPAAPGAGAEDPVSIPISERSILALIQYLSLLETGSGLHTGKLTDDQEGLVKELVSQLFAQKDEPLSAELQSWAKIQEDSAFSTLSSPQIKVMGLGSTFAAFFPTIAGGLGGDITFDNIQVPEAHKADFENRAKPNVEYLNGLEGSTVATEFIEAISKDDVFVNKLFAARLEGSGFSAPSGAEAGLSFSIGGFQGQNDGFGDPSGGFSQGGSGGQGTNTGFGNNANSTNGQFNPGSEGFTGGSGINSGNSNQQYTGGSGQMQQPSSISFGGGGNPGFNSGFGTQPSGGSGQWQPQNDLGGNQPQTGGNQQYHGGSTNQGNNWSITSPYNGNGFNPNNPYIPTTSGYVPALGQFINQGHTTRTYNGMMGSDIPKLSGPKQGSGQQPPKVPIPNIIKTPSLSPRFGQSPRGPRGPNKPH